jgi:DNA-binding MarR family transcriptional regulator
MDLQQELKQTRPFKSSLEEAFVGLQRTAALLEHALETALKPSGVTATQYNVLRILRGAGQPGLCRHEVGDRMVRRVPDVTRLLDRLEDMGLITRTRGGEDRRFVSTTITPKGLETLGELDQVITSFLELHMAPLNTDQLQSLVALLSRLRSANA